jgi:hypothetical protein
MSVEGIGFVLGVILFCLIVAWAESGKGKK